MEWIVTIHNDFWHVGKVEEIVSGKLKLKFMDNKRCNTHVWSEVEFHDTLAPHEILCQVMEPTTKVSARQLHKPSNQNYR